MIKCLTRACFLDDLLILVRILLSIYLLFSHIESDVLNFWTRRNGSPLKVGVFRRPMKRPCAWCDAENNGLAANPAGPFPARGGRAQNSALSCPPERKFTRCCHVGSWQDTRNSDVVLGSPATFHSRRRDSWWRNWLRANMTKILLAYSLVKSLRQGCVVGGGVRSTSAWLGLRATRHFSVKVREETLVTKSPSLAVSLNTPHVKLRVMCQIRAEETSSLRKTLFTSKL